MTSTTPSTAAAGELALLPCPCCSGNAAFQQVPHEPESENSGGYFIECERCGLTTPLRFSLMEDARPLLAEQWNLRTPAPSDVSALLHEIESLKARKRWVELRCAHNIRRADAVTEAMLIAGSVRHGITTNKAGAVFRDMIDAAPLVEPSAQVGEWRTVPNEPTQAMIDAAERLDWTHEDVRANCINQWHVMLAAAPSAPGGAVYVTLDKCGVGTPCDVIDQSRTDGNLHIRVRLPYEDGSEYSALKQRIYDLEMALGPAKGEV